MPSADVQNEYVIGLEDPMKVLVERLRPVARLGGITYSRTNQQVDQCHYAEYSLTAG